LKPSVFDHPRPGPPGPLSGVRVLDLSAYIAGPYGCTLLADQGADVIKVEPPGGDNLRHYPSTLAAENRAFLGVNRSKRGVVLNLKRPHDRTALYRMVREADVLVHNFRPRVPDRLGIGFTTLNALNPRLIYCALTGYGETGPMKDKAGYDQILQTMTGMCVMQGKPGGPPELIYGSVVDYYAAALLAAGVSSALYERERSGEGQYVGISLLRSALTMQSARMIWAENEAPDIAREMHSGGVTGLYPTKAGYLYISANTPKFWRALCEKTGMRDLLQDARLSSVRLRAQHAGQLRARLHAVLGARSALEWEVLFGDEVPCAAARPVEAMFEHPQVLAEDMLTRFTHPRLGGYRGVWRPIRFGRTPGPAPFSAPMLGEHTARLTHRR